MTKHKRPTNKFERRLIEKKKSVKQFSSKPKAETEDDHENDRDLLERFSD